MNVGNYDKSDDGDRTLHSLPAVDAYNSASYAQIPVDDLKLNARDHELLRECQIESMQQRCAPIAAVLAGLTHFAVHSGRLPAHPRYGSLGKVSGAVLAGVLLGKISYMPNCREKFRTDMLSEVGKKMREREGYVDPVDSLPDIPAAMNTPLDGDNNNDEKKSSSSPSYADLRRRNRLGDGPPLPYNPRSNLRDEDILPPQDSLSLDADDDDGNNPESSKPSKRRPDYGLPSRNGNDGQPRGRVNAYGDALEDV